MASTQIESRAKHMRRGTQSCKECRRRKIKCTYAANNQSICNECSKNGRTCTSQGITSGSRICTGLGKTANLQIRISRIESVIERLSKTQPDQLAENLFNTPSDNDLNPSTPNPNTKNLVDEIECRKPARAPLFALFNNETVRADDDLALPLLTSCSIDFGPAQLSDREKLLSVILKEPNCLDVLDIASSWWIPYQFHYAGLKDMEDKKSLRDFVEDNLAESQLVLVATGLLCIATSIQNMRPGVDDKDLHLSTSIYDLMNRITAAVDQVVLLSDDYVTCFEGVVLLVMRGKHHAESNQLRKAWLGIRRAILLAQKIGLALPQPDIAAVRTFQCQQFVGGLFEVDRFFSMLLGMPYAVDENFNDVLAGQVLLNHSDIATSMRALRRVTAVVAGKINDRNSGPEKSALNTTMSIQQSLDIAAASMPADWWDISTHTTSQNEPQSAYEHLFAQLWFYQTQSFLHLPYMLKAVSDICFEYSREICVHASRQLVHIWVTLRQNPSFSTYTCRLDDFQGLISAIIVLVAMLQHSSQGLEPGNSTIEDDLVLIEKVKKVFRFLSQQQGGSIARQGLQVIETLSSFLEDDTGVSVSKVPTASRKATLFVPYFGAIAIESDPVYHPKKKLVRQQNDRRSFASSTEESAHELFASGVSHEYFEKNPLNPNFNFQPQLHANSHSNHTEDLHLESAVSPPNHLGPGMEVNVGLPPASTDIDVEFPYSHPTSLLEQQQQLLLATPEDYDQEISSSFELPEDGGVPDWDRIMMGTELDQEWNTMLTGFT